MKNQYSIFVTFLLATVFMYGCSSLQLVSSWKQASTPRQTGKKILVVFHTKRLPNKMIGEEAMVQTLRNMGYQADPIGDRLASPTSYADEQSLNRAVATLGYDLVLSVVSTSEKTSTYIPGTTYYAPVGG